jgi:BASS family bile acid:Na+ symporter
MNDIWMILFKISLALFMVGSFLEMGLKLSLPSALTGLRNVRFGAYALVWSFVFCPALAYAITLVMPLQPPYALGLILVGLAPCAPFVPLMVEKAKGDLGYTAAFMILAAAGTVVCEPFTVPLLAKGLSASAWTIAKPLLLLVLTPMIVGVIIRSKADGLASKMLPFAKKGGGIAGLIWCVFCVIIYGKGMLGMAGSFALASELLFFGIIFIVTYLFSLGLGYEQKIVLSIGITTRNLGACLAPILSVPDMDQRATLMIVLALLVMVIVVSLGTRWFGRVAGH